MMPQDIVYIGCCGQTLPADSFEYFQKFALGCRTDIQRGPVVKVCRSEKSPFVIGCGDHSPMPGFRPVVRGWRLFFCIRGLPGRIVSIFRFVVGDSPDDFRGKRRLPGDHLAHEVFVDFDFRFLGHNYRILRISRISAASASICASRAKMRSGARSVERQIPEPSGSSSLLNFER